MSSGVIFFLLLLCIKVHSQDFYGAPMQGMANTGLALPSIYGLTANAAVVAKLKKPQVSIAYQPHFLSNDIQSQALFSVLPFHRSNVVGLAVNRYGLRGVSSLLTLRAIYARAFGNRFSTSIATNYHQYHVKGYGGDRTISLDLGGHFAVSQALSIGLLLRNVTLSAFEDTIDQYITKEVGMGLLYSISDELLITGDVYYNSLHSLAPRLGVAYGIDKLVVLRGGIAMEPMQYFMGIGLILGEKIQCDISSSFHTRLGVSPQVSLAYGF